MCGPDRPGAQNDSICVQFTVSRPGTDRTTVGEQDLHDPGVGYQGEVRAVHGRLQVRPAGSDPGASGDVERHRPHPGTERMLGGRAVQVRNPPMPRRGRGMDE
ncbi:hypothetical protein BHQ18_08350 [Mycolicibacterium flavescens]|uniref:Uncharacterized protein n=1 Tax=Mycolicibacterium flavescens TaxID=1776 RepID=A0A1E3RLL2_MYCFV|nr:hypothetical protein BHQ18_08350 [Mycolicibacterium flavescens]